MALTYDAFASTTLSSTATSISFSGISSAYTDLRIVCSLREASADNIYMRVNGITSGNLYTDLSLATRGGSEQNYQDGYHNEWNLTGFSGNWPDPLFFDITIPNYTNTTIRKSAFIRAYLAASSSGSWAHSMNSVQTTSAITSFTIFTQSAVNFVAGSKITLYGITKA